MKLEWIGLSILITNIVTFFGIVGGVIAIVKYLLSLKQELSDFKVESKAEITSVRTDMADFKTEVRVELVKLQARFDKYDGVNTELGKRINEIQNSRGLLVGHLPFASAIMSN